MEKHFLAKKMTEIHFWSFGQFILYSTCYRNARCFFQNVSFTFTSLFHIPLALILPDLGPVDRPVSSLFNPEYNQHKLSIRKP